MFTLLQQTLKDKSKISAGAALFMVFENLGGCSGSILVGYLIDTLPFAKESKFFWGLFPILIFSLLASSFCFYKLDRAGKDNKI